MMRCLSLTVTRGSLTLCLWQATTTPARKTAAKKGSSDDDLSKEHWSKLVASNAVQKKTVAQLKDFLQAHGIAAVGKKAELVDKVQAFVDA